MRGTGPFPLSTRLVVSFPEERVILVGAEQRISDTFDFKIEEIEVKRRFQFEIRRSLYRALEA